MQGEPEVKYYYEVGWWSHEDSETVVLTHRDCYSPKKFRAMCVEVAAKVIGEMRANEASKNGSRLWRTISFDRIYDTVVDALCASCGFERPTVTARFCAFGWASLEDDEGWRIVRDGDEDLKAIREAVKE